MERIVKSDYYRETWIYALVDPMTRQIRYIGQTVNPESRYRQHAKSNTPVGEWFEELRILGAEPVMWLMYSVKDAVVGQSNMGRRRGG